MDVLSAALLYTRQMYLLATNPNQRYGAPITERYGFYEVFEQSFSGRYADLTALADDTMLLAGCRRIAWV